MIASCFEFLSLRLKRKDIEAKLGSKLIKPVLRHLGFDVPSKKKPFDLDAFMRQKLEELFESHEDGLKCSGDSCFINQFRESHSILWMLHRTFFLLERAKNYQLAAIT